MEKNQILSKTKDADLCFPADDEKAKKDAGKWWKPWVSQPGGELSKHCSVLS